MVAKELKAKIRQAKLQLGDDFGDEEMREEAIFKAGQKEIMKWIEKNSTKVAGNLVKPYRFINEDEWQAKLKEWGV